MQLSKLTPLQMVLLARMVISNLTLTAVVIWVAFWPPESWVIPITLVGICVASIVVQSLYLRYRSRHAEASSCPSSTRART